MGASAGGRGGAGVKWELRGLEGPREAHRAISGVHTAPGPGLSAQEGSRRCQRLKRGNGGRRQGIGGGGSQKSQEGPPAAPPTLAPPHSVSSTHMCAHAHPRTLTCPQSTCSRHTSMCMCVRAPMYTHIYVHSTHMYMQEWTHSRTRVCPHTQAYSCSPASCLVTLSRNRPQSATHTV